MTATSFSLTGKIISKENLPLKGLHIAAYDDDPLLNPDDYLGEATTDNHGFFKIDFDSSKFSGFLEALEGTPDVYLIIKDNQGNELIKQTKVVQTKKELAYHIKIPDPQTQIPNSTALDIYSGNPIRMLSMLTEVGGLVGLENRINLDILRNAHPPEEIRQSLQDFTDRFEERQNNFNQIMVILSSIIDLNLEDIHLGTRRIGYDGPQVPRYPRREFYDQVIIWPRDEEFKWA
jgi:hypothetical protein